MTDDVPHLRRRRWLWWTIAGIAVLVLFCLGWVAIRGLGASAALSSAARTADQARDVVNAGGSDGLSAAAKRIAADAANARELTGDPLWRAMEVTPWLGAGLTALREVSEATDDIAHDALPPLVEAAESSDLATIGIVGSRLNPGVLAGVAPQLDDAAAAFARAERKVSAVSADGLLPPFAGAIGDTLTQIRSLSRSLGALSTAAEVLPVFATGQAPHNMLVIVQDNGALRSSGGVPAGYALLRVQNGSVALAKVAGYDAFRVFPSPIGELSPATTALFGTAPATRIEDALSAPSFPEAAAMAATMWSKAKGDRVDAVAAIDAVALARLLEATGPVTVSGIEVSADDVATVIAGGGADHAAPAPAAFVAELVSRVYAAIAGGDVDVRRTVRALADAGEQGRLRLWFADAATQERIAATTLAGTLPDDTAALAHAAVLANDAGGGWMDAYAGAAVTAQLGACGKDGRAVLRVTVDWSNTLTADAAASLPDAVTAGAGGTMTTRVAVVGPEGWTMSSAAASGEAGDGVDAEADGRAVRQYALTTPPGGTQRVTVEFTAPDASRPRIDVHTTPMLGRTPVTVGDLACG